MLSPRKVKHRKQFKGRMRGAAQRGEEISFGDFGLKAMECGKLTAQQIEATRPGVGYPKGWEDQNTWRGGWERTASGRLRPHAVDRKSVV